MPNVPAGVKVDATTTAPEFDLGDVAWVKGKAYKYIQANGAITGDGYVVSWKGNVFDAAMGDTDTAATVAEGVEVGVVECVFADNEYGWAQVYGACGIRTEQDATTGKLAFTADAGQVDDAPAAGKFINGMRLGTATGGADAVNATGWLYWPTVEIQMEPET